MVRARFKVYANDGSSIGLRPTIDESPENAEFFSLAPNGQIILNNVSQATLDALLQDQEYFVDFVQVSV